MQKNNSKFDVESNCELRLVLAGNPNVGKTTLFNHLTGMKQHTGNWAGKTVSLSTGEFMRENRKITVTDLPGTYSLLSDSPEEKVAKECIESVDYSCVIIVVDSTTLERNLNLVLQILSITQKAVLCLNFSDELKKKGVSIDTDELSLQLGIPVVLVSSAKNKGIDSLIETAVKVSEKALMTFEVRDIKNIFNKDNTDYAQISERISEKSKHISDLCVNAQKDVYSDFDKKLDKIFLSPITGIPVMILVFVVVFWLTAYGANYPSEFLSSLFSRLKEWLKTFFIYIQLNNSISSLLIDGIYVTVSWVVSVMLPPAIIFFPLFAILEDTGILPRFAFNLDRTFAKAGSNGKQSLTMMMGFGCNACGVMGCRIISNKKERVCAIITNSFIPCNGRLPTLIALISIFFCNNFASQFMNSVFTTGVLLLVLLTSVMVTLAVTFVLSKIIKEDTKSGFVLELPPFRKPQILKVILLSMKEKVLYVLSRAIIVAVPTGVIIWLLTNIEVNNTSILEHITSFLNPFAYLLGIDGVILCSVFLSFPANEILIPVILMAYSSTNTLVEYPSLSELGVLLAENGWIRLTALCVIILCLFHFPCSTTCFSIKKETGSNFLTFISILIPLVIGFGLCFILTSTYNLVLNLFHISF